MIYTIFGNAHEGYQVIPSNIYFYYLNKVTKCTDFNGLVFYKLIDII